jgi:hypothetical protein
MDLFLIIKQVTCSASGLLAIEQLHKSPVMQGGVSIIVSTDMLSVDKYVRDSALPCQ